MSKSVMVGNVQIGGGAPVVIQSMTNTDTRDREATLKQIIRLYRGGLPDRAAGGTRRGVRAHGEVSGGQ